MSVWHRALLIGTMSFAVVLATSPSVTRADDSGKQTVEARAHFNAGVALLSDPDGARYEEAYGEFKQAYKLSGSPKVLGNLGLCSMKLEKDGEAIESYTRYLAEVSDIDKDERAQIERDLQTLRVGAVHVDISVDKLGPSPKDVSIVDTRIPISGASFTSVYQITTPPLHLLLHPGHHVLVLRVGNTKGSSWDMQGTPGGSASHTFDMPVRKTAPDEQRTPASLTGPILVTGLGVAGFAAGGVLGIVTLKKVSALEKECPTDKCLKPGAQGRIDTAHTYVRATDFTLLGSGIVTAVGASWLIYALVDRNAAATHAHQRSGATRSNGPTQWNAGAAFDAHSGFASVGAAF